jgi:N-acetylmuramoyl-L-alanine amidase
MNRHAHTRRWIGGWVTVLLLAASSLAQENSVTVSFPAAGGKTVVAGAFHRQGQIYVSLTDLAQVLRVSTYENAEAGKLELKYPQYRVKVTRGSPFIVITNPAAARGRTQTVVQLPHDVLYAANAYFVPVEEGTTTLSLLLNTAVTFDRPGRSLTMGGTRTGPDNEISAITLDEKTNGTLIRIRSASKLSDIETWLRQDNWLYVTIPDARADTTALNATPGAGVVRGVVAIQTPTALQLTFRLTGKIATSEVIRDELSNDLLISVRSAGSEEKVAPPPPPPPQEARPAAEPREDVESDRKRWNLDVIVLDAGHGGKDWGAIGVSGVREKDVTLGITLKLGRLLERNMKDVKVVYTRKDDRFIELDRRGQIANAAGGKLFISIHANSLRRKPSPTRGFEVYLLRPGKTEDAIAIAERENSVIEYEEGYAERYKELTDENFILVTMAQSAYMRSSEDIADMLQQELEKATGIPNKGVRQAGFYVLVGASMPNVLVETAYLSNREDERLLKSERGQQQFADAIYRAVKRYGDEYEKVLREGSAAGAGR